MACVVAWAPAARAQSPAATPPAAEPAGQPRSVDVEVERHAALGQRLLDGGRTQDAIGEFRRAYELRADARFLFDIADCYRRLGLRDQARFFYERYLSAAPDAPDREDVEEALAALARSAPVPGASPPSPTFARDTALVPGEARPLWRRWWAWAALGAVVLAGVATALATRQNDTEVPATALGDKRFFQP